MKKKLSIAKLMLLASLLTIIIIAQDDILTNEELKPYMFTTQIDGKLNVIERDSYKWNRGQIIDETYTVYMDKKNLQLLPEPFNSTPCYAYGGKIKGNRKEIVYSYPGPAFFVKPFVKSIVNYVNNIQGPHILPLDFSNHFRNTSAFRQQVPVVPHLHGGITDGKSDGYPQAYWTKSGARGPQFATQDPSLPSNWAQFQYPNEISYSLQWYHDHAVGITRNNVYAGLIGYYQVLNYRSSEEEELQHFYGKLERKHFVITDKTFKKNGELFYPDVSINPTLFQTWVPGFDGNTILVNGKVWPKIKLTSNMYRFVILNACNHRYLNLHFINQAGQKIPFELIRADSDYYRKPVIVQEFFLQPAGRTEIVIDFTDIQGSIMFSNDAISPSPFGVRPNPEFEGKVMKIQVKKSYYGANLFNYGFFKNKALTLYQQIFKDFPGAQKFSFLREEMNIKNVPYPVYSGEQAKKVFYNLGIIFGPGGLASVLIDGLPFHLSDVCTNRNFNLNEVYDIYFINGGIADHPMHTHIVNFQKIARYPFDAIAYQQQYERINGPIPPHGYDKVPEMVDPTPYFTGPSFEIPESEKVFKDVINVEAESVVVLRTKFAHIDDRPFNVDLSGDKFLFHCHILEHEDNDMMSAMCIN